MVIRRRARRILIPLVLYSISAAVAAYFVHHAHSGARGFEAREHYEAQADELTKTQLFGKLSQGRLADHPRPHPRQVPLVLPGIPVKQMLRNEQLQHRIAQKLQSLVVVGSVTVPPFVGEGGMGESLAKQLGISERNSELFFQSGQVHRGHPWFRSWSSNAFNASVAL